MARPAPRGLWRAPSLASSRRAPDQHRSEGAVRNGSMAETVYPAHALMTELVKEPFNVDKKGEIELPDTPGLGVELDPKVVKKYRV